MIFDHVANAPTLHAVVDRRVEPLQQIVENRRRHLEHHLGAVRELLFQLNLDAVTQVIEPDPDLGLA